MGKIFITKNSDPFLNNVSLLLPFDGSFNDASNNNFTVTTDGNVQISNAQSKFGGGSALFDGSGDYLELPLNSAFDFGSGNFTIECWFYSIVSGFQTLVARWGSGGNAFFLGFDTSSSNVQIYINNTAAVIAGSPQINQWNHVAVVRDGSNIKLFLNGTQVGSAYNIGNTAINSTTEKLRVGDDNNGGNPGTTGYIDDLRITKGVARYTSNFAPPGPLFNIGKLNIQRGAVDAFLNSVSLLLPMNTSFADFSSNNFTLTANGNVQISSAQSKFGGGSAYFDGNGDYLEIAGNSTFDFYNTNYTVEMWVFSAASQSNGALITTRLGGVYSPWELQITSSNKIGLLIQNGSSSWYQPFGGAPIVGNTTIPQNQWTHIAWVCNGANTTVYVNGVADSVLINLNTLILQAHSLPSNIYIGKGGDGDFNGYIDDLRITKGVARYTSNFTPPGPLFDIGKINISNSVFPMKDLLAFWRLEGLTDSSGNGNSLTNNNSVQFVAGKIGNCAEFNGSNNYLSLGSFSSSFYSNSPYTFSLWYNITTLKNYFTLIGCFNTVTFNIHGFANGDLDVNNSAAADASIAGFFTTNSWNHMVVSRDISGNIKIYKNAVQLYNAPAQVTYGLVPFIEIGALSTYGSTFATDGKIDAVGIWTRELTEQEIETLYNNGEGLEP